MKIEDLKLNENGEITRFCYKPEYSIKIRSLRETLNYNYEIRIMHRHPDASRFKTKEDIDKWNERFVHYYKDDQPVVSRMLLDENYFEKMTENEFWEFLYKGIKSMEDHEIKEWFKVDGKYFKNPHPMNESNDRGIPDSECFNV